VGVSHPDPLRWQVALLFQIVNDPGGSCNLVLGRLAILALRPDKAGKAIAIFEIELQGAVAALGAVALQHPQRVGRRSDRRADERRFGKRMRLPLGIQRLTDELQMIKRTSEWRLRDTAQTVGGLGLGIRLRG
jgi:hypothetical protein